MKLSLSHLWVLLISTTIHLQAQQNPTNNGEKYWQQAMHYQNLLKFDSMMHYLHRAEKFFLNAQKWDAYVKVQNEISKWWIIREEPDSLMLSSKAALQESQNLPENHYQRIKAFFYAGVQKRLAGHTAEATRFFQQCLSFFEFYYPTRKNDIANTYRQLGEVKYMLLQYDSALQYAEKALQIFDTTDFQLSKILETNNDIAETALLAGNIYSQIGQPEKALSYYQQAVNVQQNLKEKSYEQLCFPYLLISQALISLNNLELAYEYYQQSQLLAKNTPSLERYHPILLKTYADIEFKKGNWDIALSEYQKALEAFKQTKNGENKPETAQIYASIAEIYALKQLPFEKFFRKAESICRRRLGNFHPQTGVLYYQWAHAYFFQHKKDSVLKYTQKSIDIYKFLFGNKHPFMARVYNLRASIFLKNKQYEQALNETQMAMIANIIGFDNPDVFVYPLPHGYQDANILLETFLLKASSLEQRSTSLPKKLQIPELEAALYSYLYCDQIAEDLRHKRKNYGDKLSLVENARKLYGGAVRISAYLFEITKKNKYRDQVFYFAEKSRAPILADEIAELESLPAESQEKIKKTKLSIAEIRKQIALSNDYSLQKKWQTELFNLERNLEQLQKSTANEEIEYKSNSFRIKDLQKIIDKNTAIRSYFIQDSMLYIHTITKKFSYLEVQPKHSKLEKMVKAFRMSIIHQNDWVYEELGYELYKILFPRALPPDVYHIIIIPDVELATLPFEALLTQKINSDSMQDFRTLPYLIKSYFISYSYSATLFYDKFQKEKTDSKHIYQFIGFAPVFDSTANHYFSSDFHALGIIPHHKLNPIPQSETEIKSISKIFLEKGEKAHIYLRNDANEGKVKSGNLRDYRYIHWATHGFVHTRNPDFSCIIMASEYFSGEDGYLFSPEIANLQLSADLVTLSACETGLGQINPGEGLIGMTRSLLIAGARNVIVSLWKVADESTSQLMVDFYKSILDESIFSYSIHLHNAKRKMIEKGGEFAHPYYWSAFVLHGK
ncbi:MAG: CHAT domain-containing protein [Cytophagales bacterium]|nr:CHAT domain-containing protein [Cytophagales bacterium]MDW8383470.1 CHAT domain-containing tetratricopeptide repeat protein [Flammeovirgaceae bacterium]